MPMTNEPFDISHVIYTLSTGTVTEIKATKKMIEQYWHRRNVATRKRNTVLRTFALAAIEAAPQVASPIHAAALVAALKLCQWKLKDNELGKAVDFYIWALGHSDGRVRQQALYSLDWFLMQLDVDDMSYRPKVSAEKKTAHRAILVDLWSRCSELFVRERSLVPKRERNKQFVERLKPGKYKSVASALVRIGQMHQNLAAALREEGVDLRIFPLTYKWLDGYGFEDGADCLLCQAESRGLTHVSELEAVSQAMENQGVITKDGVIQSPLGGDAHHLRAYVALPHITADETPDLRWWQERADLITDIHQSPIVVEVVADAYVLIECLFHVDTVPDDVLQQLIRIWNDKKTRVQPWYYIVNTHRPKDGEIRAVIADLEQRNRHKL